MSEFSVISDPVDVRAVERALARTYDSPTHADPWTAIEEYERVRRVAADHPEKGSAALSSVVGLPRSRIRTWIDGDGMPDAYRGIRTAADRGWLCSRWDADSLRGLNALVASVYAGGSITTGSYVPRVVAADAREYAVCSGAADRLGVTLERKTDAPPEYEPRRDASVLGRLLVAYGCPQGGKRSDTVTSLPPYLDTAPRPLRCEFAQVYVALRGHDRSDRPGVQISESRSGGYRAELEALFVDVVGDASDVSADAWPIYVSGDAYEMLTRPPQFASSRDAASRSA